MARAKEANEEFARMSDLEFVPDATAPSIYTDAIRVWLSPFDLILVLTKAEPGSDGAPRMKHAGTVYLSPQHAKALAELLTRKVAEYEERAAEGFPKE